MDNLRLGIIEVRGAIKSIFNPEVEITEEALKTLKATIFHIKDTKFKKEYSVHFTNKELEALDGVSEGIVKYFVLHKLKDKYV